MRIIINTNEVTIPSTLSEITLGQRIDFYNLYGHQLDEMAESILSMEDGLEKDLDVTAFQFEKMFRVFAFFAGCTVDAVRESEFIDEIADIYFSSLVELFDDNIQPEPLREFTWRNETWELHEPELKYGDAMTFGELIDSKQVVKDSIDQGQGKWEYVLKVCAIFLRKKDEAYRQEFLYEGSERVELMKDLPMDIALQVAFFLSSSMSSCLNTLPSSRHPKLKEVAVIPGHILKGTAGSIFLKALLRPKLSMFREVA